MIRIIVAIASMLCTQVLFAQQWVQVWGDEFNTPGLPDTARWSYEKGLIRNNESQYYTESRSENARIEDTCLIIEVRAKIPTGKGSWPAIWMLPSNNLYGGWPYSGEIDIMENVGYDPQAIVTTLHFYGTDGSGHQSNGSSTFRNTPWEVFYTYAIEWTPEQIDWYIDHIKVHTYYKPNHANQSAKAGWNDGVYFFEILKKTVNTEWWHMGDQWLGIPAVQGKTYRIKFDAWADAFAQMGLSFSRNHPDYSAYYEDPAIDISRTRTTYTRIFTFDDPSDNNCRLYFGLGRFTGKVYLDNVSMAEYDPTPVDNIGGSGEIPELTVATDHASHLLQVTLITARTEDITLSVCNLNGATIATLRAGELIPGTHRFQYQTDSSLPGGLYLLRAQTLRGESFTKFILC